MAEKPGRRKTIAVRILELAMALSPGDALPDTPELARQLEVGETTVYQVRSALTVRGELLYTDHAWRLSPQQRLAGQQSVTRAISGHWLCCLPVGKRVRYFVVDVTQRREVVVFAANAGGEYWDPGAVVSDRDQDLVAVAEGSFTAIRDAAVALQRRQSIRTQRLVALIRRSPSPRTITVCVAGSVQAVPGWFAYWEGGRSGGFALVRHVTAGDDDDRRELIVVQPADRERVPLDTPPVTLSTSDPRWLHEIDRGCFPAIERAIGEAISHIGPR